MSNQHSTKKKLWANSLKLLSYPLRVFKLVSGETPRPKLVVFHAETQRIMFAGWENKPETFNSVAGALERLRGYMADAGDLEPETRTMPIDDFAEIAENYGYTVELLTEVM
ncbi:MAG: hypothetical protein IMZ53_11025 [Thermoplasmata archaeon]|nr:hypothetical protein [Thermoplasmata archaeon]